MKTFHILPLRLCMGALVCFSLVGVRADPLSTSPAVTTPGKSTTLSAEAAARLFGGGPSSTAPNLPKSLTSVVVDFGEAPRGESVKLLDAPVTFSVKDVSFLSALDAVLASAGSSCRVECRGVKAMKMSLQVKGEKAAPVLDALATAGGCDLWVLPSKLIIAPEALLTNTEKKTAKQFDVLLSKDTLPAGSALGHVVNGVDILDVANTKISVDLNNASTVDALRAITSTILKKPHGEVYKAPQNRLNGNYSNTNTSAHMQDVTYGEALAFIAHANGCELFLLPDKFLICSPDEMTAQDKKQAVAAFTSPSTHFDFSTDSSTQNT